MAKKETEVAAKAAGGGSGTMKTLFIVFGVLVLEGATIVGTMYFSGGPSAALGDDAAAVEAMSRTVELMLINKKFFNQRSGRGYYYDAEIYVSTQSRHETTVADQISNSQAALTDEVDTLIRRADHSVFLEPTRATLKRKLKALLDERFGYDDTGRPIIEQVLIQKCIPYPADI